MRYLELVSKHYACVYCLQFPNGRCYVGKSSDIGGRMRLYEKVANGDFEGTNEVSRAIIEFGLDSVDVSILATVKGLDKVDTELCLSILEIKYIREFDCLCPKGYNVSLGGESLGIPPECITTDTDVIKSLRSGNKVLLEYDLDGNFVKEYPSIARFAYEKGYIEDSVRAAMDKSHAFKDACYLRTKRYDYVPERIEVPKVVVKERVKYVDIVEERRITRERVMTNCKVAVIVYDINGDFVGEYESMSEACRCLSMGGNLILGVYRRGYIAFRKTSDDYPKKIEGSETLRHKVTRETYVPASELEDKPVLRDEDGLVYSGHRGKHTNLKLGYAVNQFKLNGEFVAQYESLRDAADITGVRYSSIYACVMGKMKKAEGYIWRKAEESE